VRIVSALCLLLLLGARGAALPVETLRSTGGLPPHIVGLFEEPINFQQVPGGPYYVFDRRAHAVYTVDADRSSARKLVEVGQEAGKIIQPSGFDVAPNGSFVVADAPRRQERIQFFGPAGLRTGGFFLPGTPTPGISIGTLVLNGVGSIQYTGERLLISHPESGALFTEYGLNGIAIRSIGRLRPTGYEAERDLHHTMNAGIPLVDPTGGFYYAGLAADPLANAARAGPRGAVRHADGAHRGRRSHRTAVGLADGAVHLRLRPAGRQGADRAVQRRRHDQPDEPLLHAERAPAGDAWVL
jgi:hypothetical protein